MWKKIGIVIGGTALIWGMSFCGINILSFVLFSKGSPKGFTQAGIPLILLIPILACWSIGLWMGRKIEEKGWLYGGLPALIFVATMWTPALIKHDIIARHIVGWPLRVAMPAIIGFSAPIILCVLAGIAGGIRGERAARKRKTRIKTHDSRPKGVKR
jgi:hypothetical protein